MNTEKLTITEALAEIKTIGKRIETKQAHMLGYLARDSRMRDPLDKDGGSVAYIERERQGINDLSERLIELRTRIQKANMATQLALDGSEMSVYEWLIWRREVYPKAVGLLDQMWMALGNAREGAKRRGVSVVAAAAAVTSGNSEVHDLVVNVNEQEIAKAREKLAQTFGELDGRLSLINATTTI